ncbi:MAG: NAD(P)-dependent glycerol-3-phosphate dehydrogenase [Alphaproteobacteria bacterium]|nr:NAD(P)-dependent glycerol-3-phosphate dehydrogenase [Alphaproteobacteria bacterium]
MKKIAVLGAGAWGTALAHVCAKNVEQVKFWARETELVNEFNKTHINSVYLPDVKVDDNIVATSDLKEAIKDVDAVLLVIPAQFLRSTLLPVKDFWRDDLPTIICAKGIEQKTGKLMSETIQEIIPNALLAVLSGPTFAEEVAMDKPTALTLACKDEKIGKELMNVLSSKTFRPYFTTDIIGVQVGGAVKNVMAIAAGIVAGKKLGDNAHAALITRGLAEINRLAISLGANPITLMGLAGIGDLVLTANSTQSRNFTVGLELGKGKSLSEILDGKKSVAEGVYTASAVLEKAKTMNIEMPICEALSKIMNDNEKVDDIIFNLFDRPLKSE